jgi:uncharacterized protein
MFEKELLSSERFIKSFEESGSVGESRGMMPVHLHTPTSHLTLYSKTHSYGEYIFDWAWANAYEQYGIPYYPKLVSMVPFTPATHSHLKGEGDQWEKILTEIEEKLLPHHSSSHFLFITPEEILSLKEKRYLIRESFQYHFLNEGYEGFDDFLKGLKGRKAKTIRQERCIPDIEIQRLTNESLTTDLAHEMYSFYLHTLERKGAIPYLTKNFFERLFTDFRENCLYIRALKHGTAVAGSLFYYDEKRLFGRYWGASEEIRHLHFELCYYQGIEFCIERGLKIFEAGAQGEHKISRGFRPIRTYSAHRIKEAAFEQAISDFIEKEKREIATTIDYLSTFLPFKNL